MKKESKKHEMKESKAHEKKEMKILNKLVKSDKAVHKEMQKRGAKKKK